MYKVIHSIEFAYKLDDKILKISYQYQYLGITLDKSMHWSHLIQTLCKKANKTLNFIQQNLNKCNRSIKASAYLTIIRPLLEYASCVWDPHQICMYIWFMTLRKSKSMQLDGSCWTIVLTAVWQRCWSYLNDQHYKQEDVLTD